ncbi:hypothetical protein EGR_09486 [Echinococcus granulosus]|uniref:Uncharacterized protein n=1 Tax=Echinococcus granulosus TaxID=6210 RepID=W6UQE9_ECHGR|nr:hypothetical protein EGR_09486 [Echinococcus granulosus]EUB55634.1 hypothetical protein EGR_09486 [Echinococcus granulosus]
MMVVLVVIWLIILPLSLEAPSVFPMVLGPWGSALKFGWKSGIFEGVGYRIWPGEYDTASVKTEGRAAAIETEVISNI